MTGLAGARPSERPKAEATQLKLGVNEKGFALGNP